MTSTPNLNQSQQNINELLEQIERQESFLGDANSEDKKRGTTAIKRLKETKVYFGEPEVIPLDKEKLTQIVQIDKFNFYYLPIKVNFEPQPSVLISQLNLQLKFSCQGETQPIVKKMFPITKWQEKYKVGTKVKIGLDANLNLSVRDEKILDSTDIQTNNHSKADNSAKMVVSLGEFNYRGGNFSIYAAGEDCSRCIWRIEQPEVYNKSIIQFLTILKVPKNATNIDLTGEVWVTPSIRWLCGNIEHVFEALPGKFKNIFANTDTAGEKFAVGQESIWNLTVS